MALQRAHTVLPFLLPVLRGIRGSLLEYLAELFPEQRGL